MTARKHLVMWLITFLAWLGFYLLGLPSAYFTEWDVDKLILLSLVTAFAIVPLIGFVTLVLLGGNYVQTSLWCAFYGSVPLFVYDLVLEGLIGGEGLVYLISHWYLAIAYVYVWIELPIIGLALTKFKRGVLREFSSRSLTIWDWSGTRCGPSLPATESGGGDA